jgi:ABC-type Fe3+ transport system permease subunit
MRRRFKSERLAYVQHPVMERLIILCSVLPLYVLVIPWLFMDHWDFNNYFNDYFDRVGWLGAAVTLSVLSALLFLVLLVVYAFLNMRPQDRKGNDPSFNLATALGIYFGRSLFKFLVLGLFAPITIFLIRADFKEECSDDISDSYRL